MGGARPGVVLSQNIEKPRRWRHLPDRWWAGGRRRSLEGRSGRAAFAEI